MATPVFIPDLGKTVEKLKLVTWLKEEGQHVDQDEPLCEVETDKALGCLESPASGVLLRRFFEVGDMVKTGQVIAYIGVVGEAVPDASAFVMEPPVRTRITQLGRARLAVCATCDEYNGNVCEELFPTGCCYGKWRRILDEPERSCPLKKW